MPQRIKRAIRLSRRVRVLSAIAIILACFSLALSLPDITRLLMGSNIRIDTGYNEYSHIILSVILLIISWFYLQTYNTQKQIFSIIESPPHAVLLFSNEGHLITASQSGRNFMRHLNGHEQAKYHQFIEQICLRNIGNNDILQHISNPLISSIKHPDAIFQDIYKSSDGHIYLIQCQEIDFGMKIILVTDVTQIHDLNKES